MVAQIGIGLTKSNVTLIDQPRLDTNGLVALRPPVWELVFPDQHIGLTKGELTLLDRARLNADGLRGLRPPLREIVIAQVSVR